MTKSKILTCVLTAQLMVCSWSPMLSHADELLTTNPSTISMDFTNASLRDVLKIFSKQSQLNFVASRDVEEQTVNLFLDHVSVQDALDSIIGANNLRYTRKQDSQIFVVYPSISTNNNIETKVFFMKYKRLSSSAMDVGGQAVIGELSSAESSGEGSGSSNSSSGVTAGVALPGVSSSSESSSSSGGQRGIDQILKKLLSKSGTISVDLHTNSVIVSDKSENLRVIESVLDQLDVPTKQVMLEVQILEISSSLVQDKGVDWGGTDGALLQFTGGSRTASFPFQESVLNSFDATTGAKSSVTLGTLSAANFTFILRHLVTQSDTKILARPRVLTINNEAAIIKLSTQTSIAKVSEQSSSEGVSLTTSDTAEREETGIVLKMTPQINLDQSVEMYLEPSITTVSPSTFFSTDFLDPTTRSVRTTVRVFNHETIVIGGLIDSNKNAAVKKIPFLGDIPYIGNAFKYTDKDESDKELLIFITPHIIDVDEVRANSSVQTVAKPNLAPEFTKFVKEREQIIENALVKAFHNEKDQRDIQALRRNGLVPTTVMASGRSSSVTPTQVAPVVTKATQPTSLKSKKEILEQLKVTTQPDQRAELLREWARLANGSS